jgi:hypothetical protein
MIRNKGKQISLLVQNRIPIHNFHVTFSLIIHEENTKKNHKRVVSLYVIEISLDLHKL